MDDLFEFFLFDWKLKNHVCEDHSELFMDILIDLTLSHHRQRLHHNPFFYI